MFRFENPTYLYLLILLPLLALLFAWAKYRRKKALERFGDPALLSALMPDVSSYKPTVKFCLVLLSVALFALLLARPQFGTKMETVKRQGIEAMIVLDISNSMLAEDVQPSRLEKAKRIVSQLVDRMEDDKVGLIVFAGDAFTQLPITNDFISAKMFLESISPALINRQGTDIASALSLAGRSFTGHEGVGRTVLLITDGENHEGNVESAIKNLTDRDIQLNVIGIGSPDGAPIPTENANEYRRDGDGNIVITKLNEQMCQDLARQGNGIYVRADNTNTAQRAVQGEIDKLAKADVETQVYSDYNEQFQAVAWLLLLALVAEFIIMERKNHWLKNVHLFSTK